VNRLTILQIHNHYREGGGEDTVVRKERALLESAGHEVVEVEAENPREALATARTLAASPWNLASARRVKEVVAVHRPDVAHVHNTWWRLTPSILTSLAKAHVPIAMTLHNYRLLCANAMLFRDGRPCEECVGTHPWRAVPYRCYRGSAVASWVAASAIEISRRVGVWSDVAVFLTLTEFAKERFVAGGLAAERLVVKPNFVDDPGSRTNPASESSTVLFVGRLSEEKGIRTLLDAWRTGAFADLELLVVGDGPLAGELHATAPPGVRFAGRVPPEQVAELMRRARAMVFPSVWYEGQPMVLLEALAAGLPLVVSDIGGIPETVGDGGAVSAPPGDRSAWADVLNRLRDATWIEEASLQARAVYEARYSVEPALEGLMRAYETAMERGQT